MVSLFQNQVIGDQIVEKRKVSCDKKLYFLLSPNLYLICQFALTMEDGYSSRSAEFPQPSHCVSPLCLTTVSALVLW